MKRVRTQDWGETAQAGNNKNALSNNNGKNVTHEGGKEREGAARKCRYYFTFPSNTLTSAASLSCSDASRGKLWLYRAVPWWAKLWRRALQDKCKHAQSIPQVLGKFCIYFLVLLSIMWMCRWWEIVLLNATFHRLHCLCVRVCVSLQSFVAPHNITIK